MNDNNDDGKPTVVLIGQDGNAFAIMNSVVRALRKAGYDPEEIKQYREEAMSGDYNHLLTVTGHWVNIA